MQGFISKPINNEKTYAYTIKIGKFFNPFNVRSINSETKLEFMTQKEVKIKMKVGKWSLLENT